ncbi:GAF domain-containing protein [Streptomyces sp. NPDC051214]|uniref:GAF domain-containing protein n=1 Tax=Streptomyces sp. NPDC051214 TaxID=3155282 RepID=UPI0034219E40
MSAMEGSSREAGDQGDIAWGRAVRARERAARESAKAERYDRLYAENGLPYNAELAQRHHAAVERHLTTARLQESYARKMWAWEAKRPSPRPPPPDEHRPLFMAGVAEACGTRSAALTLVGEDLGQLAVAASDGRARRAQDLEFVLNSGPGLDAAGSRRTVFAAGDALERRWPGYGSGLADLGLSTVAALPLKASGNCVGALILFDPGSSPARSDRFDTVARALLNGVLLGPDGDLDLYGGADIRAVVHQAAGALAAQAGRSLGDSLALIKARAFAYGEPPEAIARRFLSGTMEL